MLATLDLALNSIDFSDDLANNLPPNADGRGSNTTDFANVLRARVDTTPGNTTLDGDFLPPDGNSLPPVLEAIQVTLATEPVADEQFSAPADLAGQIVPPKIGPAILPGVDSNSDVGLGREALPGGQPITGEHRGESIDAVVSLTRTSTTSANGKGLPRVFVPPGMDVRIDKGGPRIYGPPMAAPRGDIQSGVAEQIALSNDDQATRATPGLPVVNPAPKTVGESRRSEVPTTNFDAGKYLPVASSAVNGARIESDSIRETARLSITRFQQNLSHGQGQVTAAPTPTSPPIAAAGSPTFVAELDLAAELINTPVRDTQWVDRIGERLLMLAGGQQRTAEIRLTPAELGPLRVQISIDEGATNVAFQAHHALTRDALEQAMPRLRELLEDSGLTLGDTSVSEQDVSGRQDEQSAEAEHANAGSASQDSAQAEHDPAKVRSRLVANGLIDTFA